MGITDTFRITGTALSAQSIHMDVIARNMASAQLVSGSEQSAYRARRPEFAAMLNNSFRTLGGPGPLIGGRETAGVKVKRYTESSAPVERKHMPESPLADEQGYIYLSNVNVVEEMAYMMQASRAYQSNLEVMNTAKQLMLRTLNMGNR
ncbi:MAG: flagellar basal body rod protein FlgC [Gammaproteobacteria bacterium]|nr:flagellar basal body rod protein FlgC [Pseudomonadales bacterium]MCP5349028.1 flagellar basal body rod protein FlgC [Pseudomonadales bacterium]